MKGQPTGFRATSWPAGLRQSRRGGHAGPRILKRRRFPAKSASSARSAHGRGTACWADSPLRAPNEGAETPGSPRKAAFLSSCRLLLSHSSEHSHNPRPEEDFPLGPREAARRLEEVMGADAPVVEQMNRRRTSLHGVGLPRPARSLPPPQPAPCRLRIQVPSPPTLQASSLFPFFLTKFAESLTKEGRKREERNKSTQAQ